MASHKRRPVRALVTLTVAIVAACAALAIGHLAKGVSPYPDLALDLKGGTQLILTPTPTSEGQRAITEEDITQAISIIRNRIDASGVSESEISSMGSSNIMVSIPGTPSQEQLDLIRSSSQMNFRPVLRIGPAQGVLQNQQQPKVDNPQSGAQSGAQSGEQSGAQSGEQSGTGAADAAQSGVQSTALDEATARGAADADGDGVLSDTPATTPENASDLAWVTEQVMYDFLTLDCSASADVKRVEGPADKPYAACDESGQVKYILGPVAVPGSDLTTAAAAIARNNNGQSTGQWIVSLQFNHDGTEKFKDTSTILYGYHDSDPQGASYRGTPDRNSFAVVLDGTVITAPSMQAIIPNGEAQISGNFTAQSATALANQLQFGSLPLNFEVESEQQISATIGTDHLTVGLWAALIGFLLVILYLIWQYRGLAIISAGSLVVASVITYLVITLLSWAMGYRLSLAGVAGLIMAIGVTTDSFIVYFERVRDEVRDGRPLRAAVEEGWDRAKRTILVSDAVNLVAAVVLYLLAVGGVQGFAFTLGITTVIDIAVIFLFTHPMMELLIRTRFFGEGHKLSGLDPEHLGAKNALVYAGRGRVVVRGESATAKDNDDEAGDGLSIAERRRAARLAAAKAEEETVDDASAETTDGAAGVTEEEEN
ncbi:protein translocase subunit SecD [Schaalia odontolytica]|uniref:Protein translocase subunit SecD n=1 Tax=Schaalia odontolytica TaxID=1660 RepID=A0A0V8RR60_9ACTO|nr:protein translocase subunit SecD [Schaalia odontolytica]KSW10484.1 preprotein translocase subunit SecD [Schaalia odontolytica]QCT35566.1 protein translocase subunit SecD [Schaalia odontolytica]